MWMWVADGQGMFDRLRVSSGGHSRRRGLIQVPPPDACSLSLIADRTYDSDPLRKRLKRSKWDLIWPHCKGRKHAPTQEGRKLRCYGRRWNSDRTFAWLGDFRNLLFRHEFYVTMHDAFMHRACAMSGIRSFNRF